MASSYKPLYLITLDFDGNKNNYLSALEASLKNGIKLVQFRSKNLDDATYIELAKDVTTLVHKYNGKVILNGAVELLQQIEADGIHFPSAAIANQDSRPLPEKYIVSIACHNLEQIQHANLINPSFAVLCPVFATPSSPKGIPIGWEKFAEITAQANFPVYALGGLSIDDYTIAREHGAYGLAAKRGLWNLNHSTESIKS